MALWVADAQSSEALTYKAVVSSGFMNVYAGDGKYYFEIPDSVLGRSIMVVSRVVRMPEGGTVCTDDQTTDMDGRARFIMFKKGIENTIQLYLAGYNGFSKTGCEKLLASFNIEHSFNGSMACIIDVTKLLLSNDSLVNGTATTLHSIQSYRGNIQVSAFRPNQYIEKTLMEINTSFILLSKKPMQVRQADKRIGYFKTIHEITDGQKIKKTEWINRWRLEPRDEDIEKYKTGELVEPKKPIVFYIDPAFPEKWIPYIIQGVNDWQPALEKAGFMNAISARRAPTKQADSSWSLVYCEAAIIYKLFPGEFATSPHIHDPRSGEIIQSRINFDRHIPDWLQKLYMIQAGPNDPEGRKMIFNDELMGKLIRNLIAHETGHALGLAHNMGASSTTPVEKLRNKMWLDSNGICSSIMDYVRYNYVAQPEDSLRESELIPGIGVYDKWAIEWGYRLFPQFTNSEHENLFLRSLAATGSKNHHLWYGEDAGAIMAKDPRAQTEDLGDNAVKAGDYGIKNLQNVMSNLLNWTNGDTVNLTRIYHGISEFITVGDPEVGQYGFYVLHVLANIGGKYKQTATIEGASDTFEYVSAQRQKEAMHFLNRQLFTTPMWLIDSSIVNITGDNPYLMVQKVQQFILGRLFGNCIFKLLSAEAAVGSNTYTTGELLADLKSGIWGELITHKAIDSFRRNLQNSYIALTQKTIMESGAPATQGILKAHLRSLQKEIKNEKDNITDAATKKHLQDILNKIAQSLKKG